MFRGTKQGDSARVHMLPSHNTHAPRAKQEKMCQERKPLWKTQLPCMLRAAQNQSISARKRTKWGKREVQQIFAAAATHGGSVLPLQREADSRIKKRRENSADWQYWMTIWRPSVCINSMAISHAIVQPVMKLRKSYSASHAEMRERLVISN